MFYRQVYVIMELCYGGGIDMLYRKWLIWTLSRDEKSIIRMASDDKTSEYGAARGMGDMLLGTNIESLKAKIDEADRRINQKYGRSSDAWVQIPSHSK